MKIQKIWEVGGGLRVDVNEELKFFCENSKNQRTNGPVNAHLLS